MFRVGIERGFVALFDLLLRSVLWGLLRLRLLVEVGMFRERMGYRLVCRPVMVLVRSGAFGLVSWRVKVIGWFGKCLLEILVLVGPR